MEQYLNAMSGKNYANFKGRSRRQEFWMFNLFFFLISVICIIIDVQIFEFSIDDQFAPLYMICSLIHLIPSLAVTVRRYHDVGYSGHFISTSILLTFVFLIGPIWAFVISVSDGKTEDNKWGSNPKLIDKD
ncbi:DUF805 domain-containing protein [Flavobacteriaceae bacterium]|nr:DUF805 domain-containing protein [Flavobacteriaceae bacterium]